MDYTINIKGHLLSFSVPQVMGIMNVTPDSFYAGSRVQDAGSIRRRAREIIGDGASIVDIGACSTRPGGSVASEEEEMERLDYALGIVREELPDAILSIDTFRTRVARMTIEKYGADIINDVGGGADEGMFELVAEKHVPYVLMASEKDIHDTLMFFSDRVERLRALHATDIILDPGYGFGKTMEENFRLLNHQDELEVLGLPILAGISRKRMVWQTLNITPDESLNGTTVLDTIALMKGADILRVHDVKAASEAVKLVGSTLADTAETTEGK